jgi:hypothetical protein
MATPLANTHDEAASITKLQPAAADQHLNPLLFPLNVILPPLNGSGCQRNT